MEDLLKDTSFGVSCGKNPLKTSVTCQLMSSKRGNLQLSILTVVLLCLQASKRMSMDVKEAHHARCHLIFEIIPLCTHLKESTTSALASHLRFIDEYCVKEEFAAKDT